MFQKDVDNVASKMMKIQIQAINTGDTNTVQPDPGKNTEQTAADTPLPGEITAHISEIRAGAILPLTTRH